MADRRPSLGTIEEFIAQKRIAVVGVSSNPRNFSVTLFREFRRQGYDAVPVNPGLSSVENQACFARVQDIQPPVQAALLMTSPSVTETVVKDCAEAGIRRVWMYRAGGAGAVSGKAVAYCEEHGIDLIPGECPFMFFRAPGGIHRFHGFLRKITGRYPLRSAA